MEAPEVEVGDAFGQMLLDCHAAGGVEADTVEVIERDDGFIGTGRAGRYFAAPDAWPPTELQLLARAHGRVLDIGCGAGRHALELQARGLHVTGLDISPGAVAVCRFRGLRHSVVGSVQDLNAGRDGGFDTFLMLGNNLGLLGSRQAAPAMLNTLATLARTGATLLGTTIDPYDTNEPSHLAYHEWNHQRGRMGGQNCLRVRYRRLASQWFDYLMFSQAELPALVAGSPWRTEDVLRDGQPIGVVMALA